MAKYRKKPVVIEAVQFDGTASSASIICQWANANDHADDGPTISYVVHGGYPNVARGMTIETLEGPMSVSAGDYVIRGVRGEFYPCKPDIFADTYELVEG